ncbi:DUF6221 family protein [Streptomyces sp. NPDC057235]|uniref:DUF6221 family protein n=1 Tax=Streptomyces sp. NPDC057235 TaxID=3346058 RepID=UPI003640AE1B
MDDLVQFLRARLDEDEQTARAPHPTFLTWEYDACVWQIRDLGNGNELANVLPRHAYGEHMARHDPARVLAEVDSKRQALAALLASKHVVREDPWYTCVAATEEHDGGHYGDAKWRGGACDCGRDELVGLQLRLLALPYADHPDYLEEWRP